MSNTSYWEALEKPPESALKKISGGRLSGKTDINPQWRMRVMTEQFGPCGVGWGYSIDKLWAEDGDGGQRFAFALISVWIKVDGQVSAPIPGIGGSMLVAEEKSGFYSNDEAYKMAVTDALSVALKSLGVAAAIYEGRWDGSKYLDRPAPTVGKQPTQQTSTPNDRLEEGRAKCKALLATRTAEGESLLPAEFIDIATEEIDRCDSVENMLGVYKRLKDKIAESKAQLPIF